MLGERKISKRNLLRPFASELERFSILKISLSDLFRVTTAWVGSSPPQLFLNRF